MAEEKEINRLINKPAEFEINSKKVFVEALPAGAVTVIIQKLIDKIRQIDFETVGKAAKGKDDIDVLYETLMKRMKIDVDADLAIYRLMLIPAKLWADKRGNFAETDYTISIEELQWNATEQQLMEIFDEWIARNPRFERQKKMMMMMSK